MMEACNSKMILLFDGIENSVFFKQVLEPVCLDALSRPDCKFFILSFEKNLITSLEKKVYLDSIIPPNLTIILKQRLPFWGGWTLDLLTNSLVLFLQENPVREFLCRGFFAARILQKSLQKMFVEKEFEMRLVKDFSVPNLMIQKLEMIIPGIASQEVLLVHEEKNILKKFFQYFKKHFQKWLCFIEEKKFFQQKQKDQNQSKNQILWKIFCYCRAMKDYWNEFCTDFCPESENYFELIPEKETNFDISIKLACRTEIRNQLNILEQTDLYCYLGGMQPWQNFELSINFFVDEYQKSMDKKRNFAPFFLVITQEKVLAEKKINEILRHNFAAKKNIRIISTKNPQETKKYLLASDYGFLLREENLINWTARPVKALEYRDAGLLVIHNYSCLWVIDFC